jgi:hypothetical protein
VTVTRRRLALGLAAVVVVASVAWALWPGDKGAARDINRLADKVARKDEAALKEEARRVAQKYKYNRPLMTLFRPRAGKGGGLGVGRKAVAVQPDGIEAKIKALARAAPAAAELEEQGDALVRMAEVTAAVAEVIRHKCEVQRKTGRLDPQDWERWSGGMRQASLELAEAVRAKDAARVPAVAARLYANCTSCHRIFRE